MAQSISRPTSSGLSILGSRITLFGYGVSSTPQVFFNVLMKKNRRVPTRWLTVFAASFRSRNRVGLVLADVLRAQRVRRLTKVAGENPLSSPERDLTSTGIRTLTTGRACSGAQVGLELATLRLRAPVTTDSDVPNTKLCGVPPKTALRQCAMARITLICGQRSQDRLFSMKRLPCARMMSATASSVTAWRPVEPRPPAHPAGSPPRAGDAARDAGRPWCA